MRLQKRMRAETINWCFFYLACLGVWLYNFWQCCEVFYLRLKMNNFKGPMK